MKFKNLIFVFIVISALFTSCNEDVLDYMGNWVTKGYYSGKARAEGTSFAINNYGYFGMGRNYNDYLKDFWKYDPVSNSWSQVADFPGTPRAYGVSISNGKVGYAGLGYDGKNDLSDMWKYDAEKDEWSQIEDFPGGKRRYATAFSIGDDIYVGCGSDDNDEVLYNDFWKYDGEKWSLISQLTGKKRRKAMAVTLDGKAYILGGHQNGPISDFWSYDPASDKWERLKDLNDKDWGISDLPRFNATVYSADGKIYVVAGNKGSGNDASCYEWDPKHGSYGLWIQKTSIETGYSREGAGSFVLNGYGYITGGRNGSTQTSYFDELYMFQPFAEANKDDNY